MEGRNPRIMLLAEATGGVMRHAIDLYKGLRARGWRVGIVLSPSRLETRYRTELDRLDQNDITYVPMQRAPHVADLRVYSEVAKLLSDSPGDTILHAHSTKAGMIGSLFHSRVRASVFTPHAYRGVDPTASGFSRTLLKAAERTFSKGYDRILTVSPGEMEYARRLGVKGEALRCIPNGLDTSRIQFLEVFQRRRQLNGALCLGFVGRLVHQKNPALFLRVLAEVVRHKHDAHAIIVGDGPMKEKLLRLAKRLGISEKIDWRGDVPATGFLPMMDVLVHTSFYEGMPYSLIEACADLLPTVATSNYGSEAVFRSRLPNNIASSATAEEIASIVLSICENESLRVEQLQILAEIARDLSADSMISRIEAEYCALAAQ
jgi:glycosyltransferase involved in cell wall biosynthesis